MNKDELIEQFKIWRDDDENKKIIAAIIALPQKEIDDEILCWLAQSYIDLGEYKRAISVLNGIRESCENTYKWQFMMGLSLLRASEDDECADNEDLQRNILERAKVCFARGMNLNPPDEVLASADRFMEQLEMLLEEINGPDEENFDEDLEAYDDEELDILEDYIKERFGEFPTVFHEITSTDVIVDIACIPPSEDKNYYTLVTMGMGAHIMNIPEELEPEEYSRTELVICLPPDWKLGENDEKWFWPVALLKKLARLPVNTDSWLGWGHSVDLQNNIASTNFRAALLLNPADQYDEECILPDGDRVNFFEVIPLYREEMNFKIKHGTDELLKQMYKVTHIVDIGRANTCDDCFEPEYREDAVDSAQKHIKKIIDKKLPLNRINGCNHIAAFMRWCIEHNLIALEFYEHCSEIVEGVLDKTQTDIRTFIMDYFDGFLEPYQLNCEGQYFLDFYYDWDGSKEYFYPADVDDFAERYFGTEKYNSAEFDDEAYLFVPFDENYYTEMSKYIDRAHEACLTALLKSYLCICDAKFEDISKLLNLPYSIPEHSDFAEDFKTVQYLAKTNGETAVPFLIADTEDFVSVDSRSPLENVLFRSLNKFYTELAFIRFPEEPSAWCSKKLKQAQSYQADDRIRRLEKKLAENLGAVPALFFPTEFVGRLLIPLTNGDYLEFDVI